MCLLYYQKLGYMKIFLVSNLVLLTIIFLGTTDVFLIVIEVVEVGFLLAFEKTFPQTLLLSLSKMLNIFLYVLILNHYV